MELDNDMGDGRVSHREGIPYMLVVIHLPLTSHSWKTVSMLRTWCRQPLLITGLLKGMNLYPVSFASIRVPTLGVVSVHHLMELFYTLCWPQRFPNPMLHFEEEEIKSL